VLDRRVSTYPTPTRLAAGGKTVVVPTAEGVITISRLLADGAPDPSFDGDGKAIIESAGFPSAHALAIQPDDKIVLIGFTNMPGPSEAATVWRLNANGGSGAPNGALDPTFGKEGTVQLTRFTNTVGLAIAVQPDGKIVAAGRGFNTTGPNVIAVWRLTEGGALDPTFDTDGAAGISDGTEDSASAIALAPDGKILIADTKRTVVRAARRRRLAAQGQRRGRRASTKRSTRRSTPTAGPISTATATIRPKTSRCSPRQDPALRKLHTDGRQPKATVWRVKPNGGSGVTNNALDPTFDTRRRRADRRRWLGLRQRLGAAA
jgi:uncharacterized delta-60 repeat protein